MNAAERTERAARVLLLVGAVLFALGALGGFVYAHDPQPDRIVVQLSPAGPRDAETWLAGTVVRVAGRQLELRTASGTVTLELPEGAPVEQLRRAGAADFAPGVAVNLGGTLAADEPVLSGVVAVAPAGGAR